MIISESDIELELGEEDEVIEADIEIARQLEKQLTNQQDIDSDEFQKLKKKFTDEIIRKSHENIKKQKTKIINREQINGIIKH